ncbi:MAG: hypothetical protein HN952_06205 [Candidatus Cloacimonetes bacterium]|jgi:hypothetical protein|nr:hypothetical protein [Candidatus Cloacimonadota bacterium]MBT7470203.1 hypothetical protein [Candidatus Cloacimonadota bacterium]
MIKHCEWLDEQPAFLKDVEFDGNKIATIHALTKMDMAEIRRKADTKTELGKDGEMYFLANPEKLEIARMYQSLVGHKKTGWEFERDISEENISLLPKKYYNAINLAILELENQNLVSEGVEKN